MSRGAALWRNTYLDFAIPPMMFQRWAEKADLQKLVGFGTASLNGFLYPVFYLLKNILGINMPAIFQSVYNFIMSTDTDWQWVGEKISANAYVSVFWNMYLDGRLIGILIGMYSYGWIAARCFQAVKRNRNVKSVAFYGIIFYGILYSFVRCQFSQSNYALSILFVLFFAFKKKAGGKHD